MIYKLVNTEDKDNQFVYIKSNKPKYKLEKLIHLWLMETYFIPIKFTLSPRDMAILLQHCKYAKLLNRSSVKNHKNIIVIDLNLNFDELEAELIKRNTESDSLTTIIENNKSELIKLSQNNLPIIDGKITFVIMDSDKTDKIACLYKETTDYKEFFDVIEFFNEKALLFDPNLKLRIEDYLNLLSSYGYKLYCPSAKLKTYIQLDIGDLPEANDLYFLDYEKNYKYRNTKAFATFGEIIFKRFCI